MLPFMYATLRNVKGDPELFDYLIRDCRDLYNVEVMPTGMVTVRLSGQPGDICRALNFHSFYLVAGDKMIFDGQQVLF